MSATSRWCIARSPFFDDAHRALARDARTMVAAQPARPTSRCRRGHRDWVRRSAQAGFLRYTVPRAWGGVREHARLALRSACCAKRSPAHDGLADFAFAMQGLGSGALTLDGTDALREALAAARGSRRGDRGVRALRTRGRLRRRRDLPPRRRARHRLACSTATKTWISNGGIADFYCVFARSDAASVAPVGSPPSWCRPTPRARDRERIDVIAPHPLATLRFDGCRVPDAHRLGAEGDGFKLAMRTLDIFRTSVAAAASASRGAHSTKRSHAHARACSAPRSASSRSRRPSSATWRRSSMPPRCSPRAPRGSATRRRPARTTAWPRWPSSAPPRVAQRIIDRAVQLHGGKRRAVGEVVERLYRDIRALRIYEGATEVQRLLVGREMLKSALTPVGTAMTPIHPRPMSAPPAQRARGPWPRQQLPPQARVAGDALDAALRLPATLNVAERLLDAPCAMAWRLAWRSSRPDGAGGWAETTYADSPRRWTRSRTCSCMISGLVPGNRVLLRGFNGRWMAAAWLAVSRRARSPSPPCRCCAQRSCAC
jgi:acyl-CoA dehydrogenase